MEEVNEGGRVVSNLSSEEDQEMEFEEMRRGPWTVEEDLMLMNYVVNHGEGRWNSLASCAGLKRTGKSCRLRWLNYLRPDVRRGNITLEEQLLILELHSRWGNRWSKIAQHLPGRTDNEIKNYWRTRVQKQAKQLKCDINSKQFKDTMQYFWMPRLVERIQAASASSILSTTTTTSQVPPPTIIGEGDFKSTHVNLTHMPASFGTQDSQDTDLTNCYNFPVNNHNQDYYKENDQVNYRDNFLTYPSGYLNPGLEFQAVDQNNNQLFDLGDISDNLWNVEDICFF